METVADSERRRWRIGITVRLVERFSPLQGDSVCGSKQQGYKTFLFRHNPVSFGFPKEMGLYSFPRC
ncbi:MAG: hypothetical protein IJB66_00860, partial [Oscillospiraceae bacterium]|nr:hypothetical protein [Oscillospiraceae bacterium]